MVVFFRCFYLFCAPIAQLIISLPADLVPQTPLLSVGEAGTQRQGCRPWVGTWSTCFTQLVTRHQNQPETIKTPHNSLSHERPQTNPIP